MPNRVANSEQRSSVDLKLAISVVILTRNDDASIAAVLQSCKFSDDIHLCDHLSIDQTVKLARQESSSIQVHSVSDCDTRHRGAIISSLATRYQWVLLLNGNERVPSALQSEFLDTLGLFGTRGKAAGYTMTAQTHFMGRTLKHASVGYPPEIRLFHRQRCIPNWPLAPQAASSIYHFHRLKHHLLTEEFSHGLKEWFVKVNSVKTPEGGISTPMCPSADEIPRTTNPRLATMYRRTSDMLTQPIRGRSLIRFLDMYLWRFGWLDGSPGFHYCAMISMYEYWTEMKMRERHVDWIGKTTRLAQRLSQERA